MSALFARMVGWLVEWIVSIATSAKQTRVYSSGLLIFGVICLFDLVSDPARKNPVNLPEECCPLSQSNYSAKYLDFRRLVIFLVLSASLSVCWLQLFVCKMDLFLVTCCDLLSFVLLSTAIFDCFV